MKSEIRNNYQSPNTTPTNSVYGAMQDGYVERFDQKISPRPSLPVYDRKRITKEGDNNFPLWQRRNKGDFVNCRSSPKFKCSKLVLNFDHSIFEFVSDFDIRISDLANLNKKESVS